MNELAPLTEPLLEWYQRERRILPWREDPTPYHVWISEIMLQQTRVEAVIDYYHRFLARFPDPKALAAADLDEVLAYWQGLGYYRRCEMLHRTARQIVAEYGGEIPSDFKTLLSLAGIGRYTAAAMMSIGFLKPYPAVDGNVLRVVMRFLNREDCIDEEKVRLSVERELKDVMPIERTSDFTQALMDLGATVCLPNGEPKCDVCPLKTLCRGKQNVDRLPVRKAKKARRREARTIFLLRFGDAVALRKRPGHGLLAKMWEFPNVEGSLSIAEASGQYQGLVTSLGETKHIFTHIEWQITGYLVELSEKPTEAGLVWVDKSELGAYAIPSAFSYFKKLI